MPKKGARKKTRGRAVGETEWNGTARFQAIAPVYGEILQLQQDESARSQGFQAASRGQLAAAATATGLLKKREPLS